MADLTRGRGRPLLVATAALLFVGGCGSCSGRSGADPRSRIPAEASAVFELSDLAELPELRTLIEQRFSAVLPAEDLVAAQAELQRSLGFDPLTEEGLKAAGLAPAGAVAGYVRDESSAWVLPVADAELARGTVTRLVQARAFAEPAEVKVDGHTLTVYGRAFGEETATVAAFAVESGLGYLGLGPEAEAMVVESLSLSPDRSVTSVPTYRTLGQALGDDYLARVLFPRVEEGLEQELRRAGTRLPVQLDEALVDGTKAAGWQVSADEDGLGMKGRLLLEGEALKAMQALFRTDAELPEGLRQLDLPGAVIYALVNANPEAVLARVAPPGSPARARLERLYAQMGMSSAIEASLTGQLSLAMGLGDLGEVDLRRLFGNPMSTAWTAIGLGVKDPAAFVALSEETKAKLTERGFEATWVEVGGAEVTRVVSRDDPEVLLVDSFAAPGGVVFANERPVTAGILGLAPGLDPLKRGAGVVVELRLDALSRQLATFDVNRLPVMFRSMVGRGLEVLGVFERLAIQVRPSSSGLALDGRLGLKATPAP